jgi:hypothetical protein
MLRKKEQCLRSHYTPLQTIIQSYSNKTAWYWHKNRHKDQWTTLQDPDINPHSYRNLIFDKGAQNIWCRKYSLFNKCSWKTGFLHVDVWN